MQRVKVRVEPRSYEVLLERGLLSRAGTILQELLGSRRRCFVVTVPKVRRLWGSKLEKALASADLVPDVLMMRDGEAHKQLSTVEALAETMVKRGADRSCAVIAFGGGVVGDVSGLLASLYMRGVSFVQIPTTLLAQVDASVGGKTGVNLRSGKNLVGTFNQPRAVLIDPDVLSTLPSREFRAGLYESIKCGVIGDTGLFERIEVDPRRLLQHDSAALEDVITASVRLKADVVSKDEREGGLRRILNFGHTIGHALEAETKYRYFLHGEAVGWGMVAATRIAQNLDLLPSSDAERIESLVMSLGRLPEVSVATRNVVRRLTSDKKTKAGKVHFVLPVRIGEVETTSGVPEQVVRWAIDSLKNGRHH